MSKPVILAAAAAAALAVGAAPAGATNECDGLRICVPVAGPWVVVPSDVRVPRQRVEFQLSCPRRHVVGGLDAELSHRAIDVGFLATLGSPVNPGISTSRAAVFTASFVGRLPRTSTFRPHIGCIPGSGGGGRIPTARSVVAPGRPTVRRVRTVRVRPGTQTIARGCARRERLVGAAHAFGFHTRTPPSASLVRTLQGTRALRGGRVFVRVRADAELEGVRAIVQVQAICSRAA